jgi:uncharacterized cupredoxin-like copper-binding protein
MLKPLGATATLLFTAMLASSAFAAATVHVSLTDDGMDAALAGDMGMGMSADMSKSIMHVTADTASVPAGDVTFEVKNAGKSMVHEMLVVKVADLNTKLPFDGATDRVDEGKAGSLGEVSELDAGKTGSLTLKLKPGTYVLFCNLRGHYMAGMWTSITVN